MTEVDAHLERWETMKRFAILDRELMVSNDGATPSTKVHRTAVTKYYGDIVDSLYNAEK